MKRYSTNGTQSDSRRMSVRRMKAALGSTISRIFSRSSALELRLSLGLESPVPHLISSNLAPTEAESVLIEATIKNTESDLDAVFEEIRTLKERQQNTSKLEKVYTTLMEFKQAHGYLLSSTRRVPPEILEVIFMAVDEDNRWLFSIPPVSQVCRLWREVALTTPSLWRHIVLNQDPDFPRPFVGMSLLNLKLVRSRKAPLDISFAISDPSYAGDPAFQRILENSYRWGTAHISVSSSMLPALEMIKGRLPVLRDLSLSIIGGSQPCTIFHQAPLLRHLRVSGLLNLYLPWDQLASYEEVNGGIVDSELKIRLLTSASTVKIHWSSRLAQALPADLLLCEDLETLHVRFVGDAHRGFFVNIRVPKIKELKVEQLRGDITAHLRVMIRNSPSPCPLQRLTFHHKFDHPRLLTALLRLTPELKELDIHIPHVEDLRNLVFNPEAKEAPLVPKLRKLSLLTGDSIYDYEMIIEMIALSRCELISYCDNGSSIEITLGSGEVTVAALTVFRLQFRNDLARLRQLRLLEDSIRNVAVPDELFRWSSVLDVALRCTSPVIENLNEVNDIFQSLMSRFVDVPWLYRTGIHLTLDHFVNGACMPHQDDGKHELRQRASEILKSWEEPILLDAPNRRWALGSDNSLFYVSKNALCPPDPFSIVYGPHRDRCTGGRCRDRKEPDYQPAGFT